ncbi:MAG: TraR/DksA family transcriptional regulator [Opitutales bacterium]
MDDVRAFLASRKEEKSAKDKAAKKTATDNRALQPEAAGKAEVVDVPPQEKRNLGTASLADILGTGPADTGPRSTAEDKGIERVPKKWVKYYKLLVSLRDQVREELNFHTQETLRRSSKEDSGDLSSYGQHQADAGTDTFERDFALSLVSNEQEALYEIEEAIGRIFDGTYGTCEVTGQPISKERLTAVPFTRFSVEGQAEHERNQRRRVDRGGVFGEGEDVPQIPDSEDD